MSNIALVVHYVTLLWKIQQSAMILKFVHLLFEGKTVLAGDAEYFDLLHQEQPNIQRDTWLTEYVSDIVHVIVFSLIYLQFLNIFSIRIVEDGF